MASLKGVKVIDMTDGVITKITYKGEEYAQVTEGDIKKGDIGLRVKKSIPDTVYIGRYYEMRGEKSDFSEGEYYTDEEGYGIAPPSRSYFRYFRKVVNLVGKFAVFSDVDIADLTTGKYYEIVSSNPTYFVVIDDYGERQQAMTLKQASLFTYEIHDEKPKFEIGDYVVPTSATRYGYTSKPHMKLGKVVKVTDFARDDDDIRVEIIAIDGDYAGSKGNSFPVNSKYFVKTDEATIAKYTKGPSVSTPLKVGDIARVVGNTFSGKVGKGRIVEIIRDADYEGDYRIEAEDGSRDYVKAESLSKLESDDAIGVGDIIRVTEFRYGFPVGTIGEVIAVLENDRTLVKSVRADSRCRFQERNVELVAKASDRADIDV